MKIINEIIKKITNIMKKENISEKENKKQIKTLPKVIIKELKEIEDEIYSLYKKEDFIKYKDKIENILNSNELNIRHFGALINRTYELRSVSTTYDEDDEVYYKKYEENKDSMIKEIFNKYKDKLNEIENEDLLNIVINKKIYHNYRYTYIDEEIYKELINRLKVEEDLNNIDKYIELSNTFGLEMFVKEFLNFDNEKQSYIKNTLSLLLCDKEQKLITIVNISKKHHTDDLMMKHKEVEIEESIVNIKRIREDFFNSAEYKAYKEKEILINDNGKENKNKESNIKKVYKI